MTAPISNESPTVGTPAAAPFEYTALDALVILCRSYKKVALVAVSVGAVAYAATFLISPTFTAKTMFLPPQQAQSAGASAIAAQLGALTALTGGAGGGGRSTGDQYVALMQSANVEDRLLDHFKLLENYGVKHRAAARKLLEQNTRIFLGKKDGLISVEVDADSPRLAADLANQYVIELKRLSSELALTEAQQRRAFFENELKRTKQRLAEAQGALQLEGFNAGALKAEPKTAAESFARLQAELTAAEVRLQTLRRVLADSATEVQQQLALITALRAQVAQQEANNGQSNQADYLGRYREFKYQETLFELFSKQYEMARLDESRDGAVVQVIDIATPPELKSKPRRLSITLACLFSSLVLISGWVVGRDYWQRSLSRRFRAHV